jgi:hypothetical protein
MGAWWNRIGATMLLVVFLSSTLANYDFVMTHEGGRGSIIGLCQTSLATFLICLPLR